MVVGWLLFLQEQIKAIIIICPSRTCERGGEGDCVKEGGGGEREREYWGFYCATSLDIEVDP
jgi:hypothetical protein